MDKIIRDLHAHAAPEGISAAEEDTILADSGFRWRHKGGIKVLVSDQLEAAGFVNGFSTRLGGVSAFPSGDLNLAGFNEDDAGNIYENRRRLLDVFEGDFGLTTVWQEHGNFVKTVRDAASAGDSDTHADAIVSNVDGILAGIKTADCVPVLVGDPETGAFAAIHAGWRGTAASIVEAAVGQMQREFCSKPGAMVAAIGPAACSVDYEIGQDVIDAFAGFERSSDYFRHARPGHAFVDLHAANRDQLLASGLDAASISIAPLCTMSRTDVFFSYRIEKRRLGKVGRLMSVIGRSQHV